MTTSDDTGSNEHVDVLPDDLNAVDASRVHEFPDNSRRRIPGVIYVVAGMVTVIGAIVGDSPYSNAGLGLGGALLSFFGLHNLASGWRMRVDEQDALARASAAVGFAVGHASAQQVWRGLRSRPTWRVLCYSAEEPPIRRGLVLVDALDGTVVQSLVEDADEAWST